MNHLLALCILFLSGCATNSLYFGAYTRVGIDASADGAGIGAKSAAVNIARPKEDGTAFDVIGDSDVDVSFTEAIITEVVATGEAAKCAAAKDASRAVVVGVDSPPRVGRVIFGSSVSWSLVELNWNNAAAPPGLLFGYKRSTGVKLPIVEDNVGSVFAEISINTMDHSDANPKGSKTKGTRSRHTFATGQAAIIRASDPEAVERLNGGDKSIKGCKG